MEMPCKRLFSLILLSCRNYQPTFGNFAKLAGVKDNMELNRVPEEARRKHVNGSVVLHATIGPDGLIEALQVISGPELLRADYLDAVKHGSTDPFSSTGDPLRSRPRSP
jgi:hypothetical protein